MSELTLDLAYITLDPEQAVVGKKVTVEGSGFLVGEVAIVEIILPSGDTFTGALPVDAGGNVASTDQARPASANLLSTGSVVTENDTVTIDGIVYTFKDTVTTVANQVKINEYAPFTLLNLKAALNLEDGAGSAYGSNTVLHPTVGGGVVAADTLQLVARTPGSAGNELAISESSAELSVSSATLTGGTDTGEDELFSFISARSGIATITINDGANMAESKLEIFHTT